ncbi:MAG: methyltransferase domain-containing protein [Bellilinea sp.]
MKYDYQETTKDLLKRIDIHTKYGSRSIDQWMLEILPLKKGQKILDVGCGAGKQCFEFYDQLKGEAEIIGADVNQELMEEARKENERRGANVKILEMDFNREFTLPANSFDLLSCCFAIYYADDAPFTIREMHRVLKPGGVLFTTGPMPDNKVMFYDIIREATKKTIPPMPGSSRYASEIFTSVKNTFSKAEMHVFENPLTFMTVEPFIEYTRASLSEDRRLWKTFFQDKGDFNRIMGQIEETATRRLEKEGKLVMTKMVGGILATK